MIANSTSYTSLNTAADLRALEEGGTVTSISSIESLGSTEWKKKLGPQPLPLCLRISFASPRSKLIRAAMLLSGIGVVVLSGYLFFWVEKGHQGYNLIVGDIIGYITFFIGLTAYFQNYESAFHRDALLFITQLRNIGANADVRAGYPLALLALILVSWIGLGSGHLWRAIGDPTWRDGKTPALYIIFSVWVFSSHFLTAFITWIHVRNCLLLRQHILLINSVLLEDLSRTTGFLNSYVKILHRHNQSSGRVVFASVFALSTDVISNLYVYLWKFSSETIPSTAYLMFVPFALILLFMIGLTSGEVTAVASRLQRKINLKHDTIEDTVYHRQLSIFLTRLNSYHFVSKILGVCMSYDLIAKIAYTSALVTYHSLFQAFL